MEILIGKSYIIWILIAISIVAFAIILERIFYYIRFKNNRSEFISEIKLILSDNINETKLKLAMQNCNQSIRQSPLAFVIKIILENAQEKKEVLESMVQIEIQKQIVHFEKFLTTLDTISTIAPLLGLLGTVLGMIKSFIFISQGNLEQGSVASGISEALITTAMGLTIAIPCVVAYNFFVRRLNKLFNDIEVGASEIINHIK